MSIHLGIITTPAEVAQSVADEMVKGGIQAIWNFAPVRLKVPAHIIVHKRISILRSPSFPGSSPADSEFHFNKTEASSDGVHANGS